MPTKEELRIQVTSRIIASLSEGKIPWNRPWKNAGFPFNGSTEKPYRGALNTILLWMSGYQDPRWFGWGQAKKSGFRIKDGEEKKYTTIYAPIMGKFYDKDEEQMVNYVRFFKGVNVYNAEQLDGISPMNNSEVDPSIGFENAEKIMKDSGAVVRHGELHAFYNFKEDFIGLPNASDFDSVDAYWSTAMHELTHWTGHDSRLKRGNFGCGKTKYAFEELVAEMGSAFMCAHLGIDHSEVLRNHEGYIQGWIQLLNRDLDAFTDAASLAWKAYNFLAKREG